MKNLNSFFLQGRIAQNAEYTTTDNGISVAKFSVAVNRDWLNKDGEWVKNVSFFPIVLFGHYADKYRDRYIKGKEIILEGHLKQSVWESNGERHSTVSLAVDWLSLPGDHEKPEENKGFPADFEASIADEFDEQSETPGTDEINCEEIPF